MCPAFPLWSQPPSSQPLWHSSPLRFRLATLRPELVQATDDAEAIAGGVLFQCVGTVCTAPRSRDRALRVCRELQREVGPIASFSSGGTPMSETQLARCNG